MSKGIYKKPKDVNKVAINTLKIVLSAAFIAIITICIYYIAVDGWESFIAWFQGKYFCMFAMIFVVAGFIGFWIWRIFKIMKGTSKDEK